MSSASYERTSHRRGADAGFTLAELLFAIVIMVIVLVGVLGALAAATSSSLSSSKRAKALTIATDRLEWARNMEYDRVGVPGHEPPGTIPSTTTINGYTVGTTVSWAHDPVSGRQTYKEIFITVSWQGGQPVTVSSAIYGKQNVGTGEVRFELKDIVSEAPLSGGSVSLIASGGTTYSGTTNVSGVCEWTGVPSGYASATISKAGFIFDAQSYASLYITPDQVNVFPRYGQSPPTIADLTVTQGGSPLPSTVVYLDRSETNYAGASTDANGTAHFTNLLIGTYTVRVGPSADSYTENPTAIEVDEVNYDDAPAVFSVDVN